MSDDTNLLLEMKRFERTVATCLSVIPCLFGGQCLFAVGASMTAEGLYRDFGTKLPWVTQLATSWRPIWIIVAIAIPAAAIIASRMIKPVRSVVYSTVCALVLFGLAQFLAYATWRPIMQLGEVLSK